MDHAKKKARHVKEMLSKIDPVEKMAEENANKGMMTIKNENQEDKVDDENSRRLFHQAQLRDHRPNRQI